MSQELVGRKPKLTPEQVARVKDAHRIRRSTPTMTDLAREYGVHLETIKNCLSGRTKRYR